MDRVYRDAPQSSELHAKRSLRMHRTAREYTALRRSWIATCTRLSGLRMLAWEVPVERHSIPCPSIVALTKSAAQEMLQRVSGSRACGWGLRDRHAENSGKQDGRRGPEQDGGCRLRPTRHGLGGGHPPGEKSQASRRPAWQLTSRRAGARTPSIRNPALVLLCATWQDLTKWWAASIWSTCTGTAVSAQSDGESPS